MQLDLLILIFVSLLLIWAGYSDSRTRIIPRFASYGLICAALIWLILNGLWWEAAFLLIAVLTPTGRMISLVSEIAGFGLLILRGFETSTIFFILGVVVVRFMMGRKWLGGGDAQVAVAMIAITRAPEFLLFLAVVTILVWMIISIKHFGFKGWLIRTRFVAKNLGRPVESDNERLRSPWVVTLAMCSLVYIWFVPGLAWM